MKSFKHEHLFYLHLYMSSQHTLSLQLGLRYRTFSKKNEIIWFKPIETGSNQFKPVHTRSNWIKPVKTRSKPNQTGLNWFKPVKTRSNQINPV